MRVICVWRRESEYGRTVEEWLTEFSRRYSVELEEVDPDTREGESICRTYDVVEYPTILALDERGAVLASWRGRMLPTFNEVSYWL